MVIEVFSGTLKVGGKKMKKYIVNEEVNQINLMCERWYEIIIDNVEHYLPSVTTYLEAFPKGRGFKLYLMNTKDPDKIMTEAGQLGSNVHDMIHRTLLGETIRYTTGMDIVEWERYLSFCLFWKEFNKTHDVQYDPAYTEQILYNLKYEVAGTYDFLPMVDGKYEMLDWKTGKNLYDTSEIQISTYAILAMLMYGIKIETCRLVHLHPELNRKGYRVTTISGLEVIKNNFKDFLHTREVWLRANKNPQPKFKSYPTAINLDFIKNNEIISVRPGSKAKQSKVEKKLKGKI